MKKKSLSTYATGIAIVGALPIAFLISGKYHGAYLETESLTKTKQGERITVTSPNHIQVKTKDKETTYKFNLTNGMALISDKEGYSRTWLPSKEVITKEEEENLREIGCKSSIEFQQRYKKSPWFDYKNIFPEKNYIADGFKNNHCLG